MTDPKTWWTCGLYSILDAARLTDVSAARVRRWATAAGQPLWTPALPVLNGKPALTFLELLEVAAVVLLMESIGASLRQLRGIRAGIPAEIPHPFVNRTADQGAIRPALAPLLDQLDYEGNDLPCRWWIAGRTGFIVLDPRVSFGAPIIHAHGVPTSALTAAAKAARSAEDTAHWFEVSVAAVEAAVEFELSLSARGGTLE